MELKSGILSFRLNTSLTFTQVDLWPGLSYCDGKWNKVIIKKNDSVISASMNELMEARVRVQSPGPDGEFPCLCGRNHRSCT